jgi:hypothetical protein
MMLINNTPPAIDLYQTHGQSELERFPLAIRVETRTCPIAVAKATFAPAVTSTS